MAGCTHEFVDEQPEKVLLLLGLLLEKLEDDRKGLSPDEGKGIVGEGLQGIDSVSIGWSHTPLKAL